MWEPQGAFGCRRNLCEIPFDSPHACLRVLQPAESDQKCQITAAWVTDEQAKTQIGAREGQTGPRDGSGVNTVEDR